MPRLLLDVGCGSGLSGETLTENGHQWIGLDLSQAMLDVALEREVEGDLVLSDMGQGLGLRPGVLDGAISISAVQWLCNADKSSHEPRLRLNTKSRKEYLVLTCGPPSLRSAIQTKMRKVVVMKRAVEMKRMNQFVYLTGTDLEKNKLNKKVKGRVWVMRKKEHMRRKGNAVPPDTKYTDRKRKARF